MHSKTLFKVKFYKSENGLPSKTLTYKTIVFRATEKDGDVYELNVEDYDIYLPNNGFFVSLQVLGYTNKAGKLLPNKKYKEIRTTNTVLQSYLIQTQLNICLNMNTLKRF